MAELHTPEEWMEILHPGVRIMDPDGWRTPGSPPFDKPIGRLEFEHRVSHCTLIGNHSNER